MVTIKILFVIVLSFSGGLAVGSGFVAFLTVLGIIPRLAQLSRTNKMVVFYQWSVVFGAVFGALVSLDDLYFSLTPYLLIPIGAFCGIFVGMLAAALTEILNVFPILAKRIGVEDNIVLLMMAFVIGKIIGSLFQWLILS